MYKGRPRWDRYEAYHPSLWDDSSPRKLSGYRSVVSIQRYREDAVELDKVYKWIEGVKKGIRNAAV